MNKMIFVNLPVKDLTKSMDFFRQLGYDFNLKYTDETAACMVISQQIYVMLLGVAKFQSFTSKTLIDSEKQVGVIIALSTESREEVDTLVNKALEAGATKANEPMDYGFMYSRSFYDLDGHMWELLYMTPDVDHQ